MTKLLVMLRVKFKDLQKDFLFRIRRRKRPDVNICNQSGDITPRIAKNRPKIDQNLWMIRKIFVKIFWLNVSKWSNSKTYIMSKVKFEDLQKIFLFRRSGRQVQKLRASPNWDVTVLHFSGAIAPKNSVCVRPSVQKLQRTALRISTKLGSKLEDN